MSNRLLESGSIFLLESGSARLLEEGAGAVPPTTLPTVSGRRGPYIAPAETDHAREQLLREDEELLCLI